MAKEYYKEVQLVDQIIAQGDLVNTPGFLKANQ